MSHDTASVLTAPLSPVRLLLRPIRARLWLAMVLAGAGQGLTLIPLAGIGHAAQLALNGGMVPVAPLVVFCLLWLGLGLALMTLSEFLAHLADNRLTTGLRLQLADHLSRLPLGWFGRHESGEIKQFLQDDIAALHGLSAHYYTTRARCIGAMMASVLFLFWIDWRLALPALLPFPLFYLIFGAAKRSISAERMQAFIDGQARINNAVVEFLQGLPVLKTFGETGRASDRYHAAVSDFATAFLGFTRPLIAPMANANAVIAPVTVLGVTLGVGTVFIAAGVIKPAVLPAFLLIAPGISAPLMLFGFLGHAVANATGAAERICAVLATPPLPEPSPEAQRKPRGYKISFHGVSHVQDGGHTVLSDIDLTLEEGSVTALVGPSGAGKSTLGRLLLRFDDPSRGQITLGDADLRQIGNAELYRHIGFVLQDVRLIRASLHDNIALGRMTASRAEVEAAARAAAIHDRIMALPNGYDTVVGDDTRLSGGEAQRVSIARAVLLDAPVLVMDEATSAIDLENEALVQATLARFAQGRTVLTIAHRLDTIFAADRIIVMDQGRIVEDGCHQMLLAAGGLYARLWSAGGYGGAPEDRR
ncbi:ABC transporter ATP-binding protein [Paracoccus caeni]|uniref:ABC transporter ATP-binding protein n=1 Tax=Paracoccus caeni TaxID=657651 RepID=A0A934VWU1_9RHOB|nr:ABC transporter ATP-binding protein [Paracoccus caeni]MBK4214307.1 ABC transporter ATP-binding protein [Paracoccus caeni]